jgi:hypothetical protein
MTVHLVYTFFLHIISVVKESFKFLGGKVSEPLVSVSVMLSVATITVILRF